MSIDGLLHSTHAQPTRISLWIRFLVVFLIFQLAYWASFKTLNRPSVVPRDEIITQFEFAQLEAPTLKASETAKFTPIKAGEIKNAHAPAYYAFRGVFTAPKDLNYNLGLGPLVNADNFHLYVNGYLVSGRGRLQYPASYHALKPEIFQVSRGLVKAGKNEVLILASRNNMPRVNINPMIVGNYKHVMDATKRKRFLYGPYRFISLIIIGLVFLISILMYPQTVNKPTMFWLSVLSGGLFLRSLIFFYYGSYGGEINRVMVYFSGSILSALAWLNYIDTWTGKGLPKLRRIMAAIAIIFIGVIFIFLSRNFVTGFLRAEKLTEYFMIVCAILTLIRLGYHVIKNKEDRIWELAALALSVTLLVWDTYGFIVLKSDLGHQKIAAPILLIALIAAGLSRNLRIYESMGAFNEELKKTLRAKETEIRTKYDELQETRRQRDVAHERQRILRDMHDGIGAQLVMLLSAARSGKLDNTSLQSALSQTLTDLRLMIDSLDSVSSDLAVALGTFRSRIMPSINTTGVTLNWNLDELPMGVTIAPQKILNIYRILQEAIANSLKHAKCREINVVVCQDNKDGAPSFSIEVKDDGKNKTQSGSLGHGLENMKKRARDIGARFMAEKTKTGFLVRISGIKSEAV